MSCLGSGGSGLVVFDVMAGRDNVRSRATELTHEVAYNLKKRLMEKLSRYLFIVMEVVDEACQGIHLCTSSLKGCCSAPLSTVYWY